VLEVFREVTAIRNAGAAVFFCLSITMPFQCYTYEDQTMGFANESTNIPVFAQTLQAFIFIIKMMPFLITLLVLCLSHGVPANVFGTTPYTDDVWHDSPQKIPGKIQFAYTDKGGQNISFHTYEDHNFGSW